MTVKINDDCTACGVCADSCPTGAIVQGETKYNVTDTCTDCLACIDVCPVAAIAQE